MCRVVIDLSDRVYRYMIFFIRRTTNHSLPLVLELLVLVALLAPVGLAAQGYPAVQRIH